MGGACYRGREGVESFLLDTWENWEELQWVAEAYRDLGDCVLTEGRLSARGKGPALRSTRQQWNLLDFRGSRFWRSRVTSIAPRHSELRESPSRPHDASFGACQPWAWQASSLRSARTGAVSSRRSSVHQSARLERELNFAPGGAALLLLSEPDLDCS